MYVIWKSVRYRGDATVVLVDGAVSWTMTVSVSEFVLPDIKNSSTRGAVREKSTVPVVARKHTIGVVRDKSTNRH